MPKGKPNKRYTGEFKQMVVETLRKERSKLLLMLVSAQKKQDFHALNMIETAILSE